MFDCYTAVTEIELPSKKRATHVLGQVPGADTLVLIQVENDPRTELPKFRER